MQLFLNVTPVSSVYKIKTKKMMMVIMYNDLKNNGLKKEKKTMFTLHASGKRYYYNSPVDDLCRLFVCTFSFYLKTTRKIQAYIILNDTHTHVQLFKPI